MHTILLIILILVALWLLRPIIWRLVQPMVQRYVARKTEDFIRRAAGMPPRPKQERRQKKEASDSTAETHDTRGEWFYDTGERRRRQQQRRRSGREPLIPKEYAVDVEFVEIRDYSSATVIGEDNSGRQQIYHESQVSDAEYVMIKPKRS
ncbi:MAG: hypothetical protein K2H47_00255 [Muribaculaceae bacterium]|nr:hypothetical protein [Muribaculaceae bacterium]